MYEILKELIKRNRHKKNKGSKKIFLEDEKCKGPEEFRFLACVIIRAALGFFYLFICISVYNPISKGPVTSIKQRQRAQEQQHSKQKEMLVPRNPPLSFGAAPLSQQAAAC